MAKPGYGEGFPEQHAAPDPGKKEDPLGQINTPQTDVTMDTDAAAARDNISEPTDMAASNSDSHATVTQTEKDYSTFSPGQKRFIIAMASLAGFFSPLSSSIYFPALSKIATDLHVSDARVNLTVTTYLVRELSTTLWSITIRSRANTAFLDNPGLGAYVRCKHQ